MTDPFSPFEKKVRTTLSLLKCLSDHDYPTLISTKSTLAADTEYLELLENGNYYFRISITGAVHELSSKLETNLPTVNERLDLIERLSKRGIPVSVRIQPLILGHEDFAANLISRAASAGARHISVEYLKWPMENSLHQNKLLSQVLPDMFDRYSALGAAKVGREYILPIKSKTAALFELERVSITSGVLFGFADNELLHLNKFNSCCNAADKFLRGATFFDANILTGVKAGLEVGKIKFSDIPLAGFRQFSINNYLNSKSRTDTENLTPHDEWSKYLSDKWNGASNRGGPSSYWGCEKTDEIDSDGNKIFTTSGELRARMLAK